MTKPWGDMNLRSLKVQLFLPLVGVILLVSLFLVVTLPRQIESVLIRQQEEILDQLVKTLAIGVDVALTEENYQALQGVLDYVDGEPDLYFAALVQKDGYSPMVIAKTPRVLPDSSIFRSLDDQSMYTVRSERISGDVFEGELYISFTKSGLKENVGELSKPVTLFVILSFLLCCAIYLVVVIRVTNNVSKGIEVAERLSKGDYKSVNLKANAGSELYRLLLALDSLATSLGEEKERNEELTQQMQSEIEAQTYSILKAQLLLNSVIDTALDAVVVVDRDGHVTNWNKKAEEIFGWSMNEALGCGMDKLIVPAHLRSAHLAGMKNYHASGSGPVLNNLIEVRALRKSGEEFDAELFVTEIKLDDEVFFSSFIRDVTENKRIRREVNDQRELLNAILDFVPGMIYLKDEQGRFVYINNRMLDAWVDIPRDYIGKTERDFERLDGLSALFSSDHLVWKDQDSILDELRIELPNGMVSFYLVGKSLIRVGGDNGGPRYLLSFAYDISSSKMNEIELERALKAKDDFVSTMSHEIRNPLNIIIGLSNILSQQNTDEATAEVVRTLVDSSNHLMGLINDILDYAKIASGKLELSTTSVDLNSYITNLVRQHSRVASEKGLDFQLELNYQSDRNVHIDELRLTQVLVNLISNACKFTNSGFVRLGVELVARSNNTQCVRFIVVDSGIGIHSENIAKILEPFTQEHASTSRRFGGSGLGLSIVTNLLELMGGELSITSEIGEGASFEFELLLEEGHPVCLSEETPAESHLPVFNLRILYVEDMLPNQFILRSLVEGWGVKLATSSSVDEAILACQREQFDLLFMDIQMPGKDGITGYAEVRSTDNLNKNVPIVAFTANAESSEVARYKSIGFYDVITKPVNPNVLLNFLRGFSRES